MNVQGYKERGMRKETRKEKGTGKAWVAFYDRIAWLLTDQ